MAPRNSLVALLVLLVIGTAQSYRSFQDAIPNGGHVPHPCKPNYIWWGVGHTRPLGGGARNPFGMDFKEFKKWTPELCRKDSDGDGKSNGEELGDPSCTWTPGTAPNRTDDITHPGVCDPWGDAKCAESNKDVTCDTGEFVCDGLDSPDVINITLRFPPTKVPAKETIYMCFTFEIDMLEPDVEYHLIASEPFIDNPYVMHHTVLTGCDERSRPMTEPAECNMAGGGCGESLAVWTLGMPGDCVYKDAGFKIGRSGFTRLFMQHHWTNPELITNYVDSSGMVLYLTKKLRKYNAGYFATGDLHLVVPPGEDRVKETSTCSSECTQKIIKEPVNLINGWNHMHYLGYEQNVEHFRDGKKIGDLTPDKMYSYDNPIVHHYDPLIQLMPGDRLETKCTYRSSGKKKTTFYGPGTYDEMCFGIFTFFPAENMRRQSCFTWDEIEYCHLENSTLYGCDYSMIVNSTHPELMSLRSKVLDNCDIYGTCRTECPAALKEVREHPCFSKKLEAHTLSALSNSQEASMVKLVSAFQSCTMQNRTVLVYPELNSAVTTMASLSGVISLVTLITFINI